MWGVKDIQKELFPYEWFDSLDKLSETSLPPIECFYNKLRNTLPSETEYKHAVKVWKEKQFASFGEQKAEDGIYQGKQTSDDNLITNSATKKHIQCMFIEKEHLGFLWLEIILDKQRLIELFGSYVSFMKQTIGRTITDWSIMRHADKQHKGLIEVRQQKDKCNMKSAKHVGSAYPAMKNSNRDSQIIYKSSILLQQEI
ncbi:hypothetical protein PROFUN_15853 [Planoprotostelium fungivorum]|uniref:Uncharacterized protein n=1 Tax=Planoprotostelium fungivorum TaxID=1890364 RepID=A0A2P6MU14_9EUKA|nr:hypothetical protein PROFUN_15853 [Planoprotostelium fungivorum]